MIVFKKVNDRLVIVRDGRSMSVSPSLYRIYVGNDTKIHIIGADSPDDILSAFDHDDVAWASSEPPLEGLLSSNIPTSNSEALEVLTRYYFS